MGEDKPDAAVRELVEELRKGFEDEELQWLRQEVSSWNARSQAKLSLLISELPEKLSATLIPGLGLSPPPVEQKLTAAASDGKQIAAADGTKTAGAKKKPASKDSQQSGSQWANYGVKKPSQTTSQPQSRAASKNAAEPAVDKNVPQKAASKNATELDGVAASALDRAAELEAERDLAQQKHAESLALITELESALQQRVVNSAIMNALQQEASTFAERLRLQELESAAQVVHVNSGGSSSLVDDGATAKLEERVRAAERKSTWSCTLASDMEARYLAQKQEAEAVAAQLQKHLVQAERLQATLDAEALAEADVARRASLAELEAKLEKLGAPPIIAELEASIQDQQRAAEVSKQLAKKWESRAVEAEAELQRRAASTADLVAQLESRLVSSQDMAETAAVAQLRTNAMAEEAISASAAQVFKLQTELKQRQQTPASSDALEVTLARDTPAGRPASAASALRQCRPLTAGNGRPQTATNHRPQTAGHGMAVLRHGDPPPCQRPCAGASRGVKISSSSPMLAMVKNDARRRPSNRRRPASCDSRAVCGRAPVDVGVVPRPDSFEGRAVLENPTSSAEALQPPDEPAMAWT